MDIQTILFESFGESLPISGGMGNSKEQAVIIHHDGMLNDYAGTEQRVLTFLGIGRRISWRILKQELIVEDKKFYDRISILVEGLPERHYPRQVEFVYFDITEVFSK